MNSDFHKNRQLKFYYTQNRTILTWREVKELLQGTTATFTSSNMNDDDRIKDYISENYLELKKNGINATTAVEMAKFQESDFHKNKLIEIYFLANLKMPYAELNILTAGVVQTFSSSNHNDDDNVKARMNAKWQDENM